MLKLRLRGFVTDKEHWVDEEGVTRRQTLLRGYFISTRDTGKNSFGWERPPHSLLLYRQNADSTLDPEEDFVV